MIVRGKIAYVISHAVVDADISLMFGIHVQRRIWLADVPVSTDSEISKKAAHCAVMLIGGKKVLIDVPETDSLGRTTAVIYKDFDADTLQKFDPAMVSNIAFDGKTIGAVNVNKYLKFLSDAGFSVEDVKSRIIPQRA